MTQPPPASAFYLDHALDTQLSQLLDLTQIHLHPIDAILFHRLITSLAPDIPTPAGLLLGFRRAPAATRNHHAHSGGLIAHLLEMWGIYQHLQTAYPQLTQPPYITPARVLKAIITHDLHKAYRTFILPNPDPLALWKTEYANDPSDLLATPDTKTLAILARYSIALDDLQLNALLWAEGGFSQIRPKTTSVLAKLCYLLDEMSGNVLARISNHTLVDHKTPISSFPRG